MIKETNSNGPRIKLTQGTRPGFNVYGETKKHNNLKNLGFEESGHVGFQKELKFDDVPTKESENVLKSGSVHEALEAEAKARADADAAFESALAEESEARSEADKQLQALIAAQEEARQAADESLSSALGGKVDKEEGKGLSMTRDVYIENGRGSTSSVIETSRYDIVTGQRIELYNREQTDGLLEGKVDKEEGKGLSCVEDVTLCHTAIGLIGEEPNEFYELTLTKKDPTTDPNYAESITIYSTEQIDGKLNRKVDEES